MALSNRSRLGTRERMARGALAGALATFFAAAAHCVSGATSISPQALGAALFFSVALSILLSRRERSPLSLTCAVLLSQAFFHGLFATIGQHHGASAPPDQAPQASQALTAATSAHANHTAVPSVTSAQNHGSLLEAIIGANPPMILGHLCAAVLTVLLLHRGEAALLACLGVMFAALPKISRCLVRAQGVLNGSSNLLAWPDPAPLTDLGAPRLGSSYRGPPALI